MKKLFKNIGSLFKKFIWHFGFKKPAAFSLWVLTLALRFPSIFFNFYLIFLFNKAKSPFENISIVLLMGFVVLGIAMLKGFLKRRIVDTEEQMTIGGFWRGLEFILPTLIVTIAFAFTTKAFPNEMILGYLISINCTMLLSFPIEGNARKLEKRDWNLRKLERKK